MVVEKGHYPIRLSQIDDLSTIASIERAAASLFSLIFCPKRSSRRHCRCQCWSWRSQKSVYG